MTFIAQVVVGMGFDKKVLKRVVAARAKDPQALMEEDLIFDTYMAALGHGEDPSED
ncbi:GapR family DNA-binding domain-containing protein [Agrobacterium vitis]|uniref:GapR family DNA-binding domain-containing protein n=1 Tax=Agrobacterium vitis TaxID=373 RepID=UPI00403E9691